METPRLKESNNDHTTTVPPAQPAQTLPLAHEHQQLQPEQSSLDHQFVGLNLEGTQPSHAPLSTPGAETDSLNPPSIPFQRPGPEAANVAPELHEKIAQDLPKSKLLHSNPEPEPKNPNLLRRTDSNTEEVDEFVDAQS